MTSHLTDLDRSRTVVREQVDQARLRAAAVATVDTDLRAVSATVTTNGISVTSRADGHIVAIELQELPAELAHNLVQAIESAQRQAAEEAIIQARTMLGDSGYAQVLESRVNQRFAVLAHDIHDGVMEA